MRKWMGAACVLALGLSGCATADDASIPPNQKAYQQAATLCALAGMRGYGRCMSSYAAASAGKPVVSTDNSPMGVCARTGSYSDTTSGNEYFCSASGSETLVKGFNMRASTMWTTYLRANGDMHGTDADGYYWTYTAATKSYSNLGTGQMCTGEGATRICNK